MRHAAACLFCVLSTAAFLAIPAASEDANPRTKTFRPWIKFCFSETCFIGAEIITECGPLAAAVLIEQSGKMTLRTTLPAHVKREPGAGAAIDQAEPILRPFAACFPNGCMADYEAGPEFVDQLKHGQTLTLSGVDGDNSAIRLTLPLAGFAEAYDGPPTKPKEFETQTVELQEELQRRADEARKRLESGQEPPKQEPQEIHCPSQK